METGTVVILWIAALAGTYLLGSVPFGIIVGRGCCRIDPRESGSGNTGATNVARSCGTIYGLLVLTLDLLKGLIPTWLAMLASGSWVMISLIALAAVAGHVFSVFLKFKGGKGVATAIGVFIPVAFCPLLISAVLCVLAIAGSRFVSVGSLLLFTSLPILIIVFWKIQFLPLALVVMILIYWRHRDNIVRLLNGQEKKWRDRSGQDTMI